MTFHYLQDLVYDPLKGPRLATTGLKYLTVQYVKYSTLSNVKMKLAPPRLATAVIIISSLILATD